MRERGLKWVNGRYMDNDGSVVPHAGTWIEISMSQAEKAMLRSFPMRERGLKSCESTHGIASCRRSPCGNVD